MFVSSFNTYVNANISNKILKEKEDTHLQIKGKAFSSFIDSNSTLKLSNLTTKPISYTTTPQSKYTQQLVALQQNQLNNSNIQEEIKKTINASKNISSKLNLNTAFIAYSDNSRFFSLMKKPQTPLNQTPQIDTSAPKELQKAQEIALRTMMVNTYKANDFYFKITA